MCRPMAEVLKKMGSEHVFIVHSKDGLDELSISADSYVAELKSGEISEYTLSPKDYGVYHESLEGLSVDTAQESLSLISKVFKREDTPIIKKASDIIAFNAGAAIYVAGLAKDLGMAVEMAQDAILSGLAGEKLHQLVEFSQC